MASAIAIIGAIACFYMLSETAPVGPALMTWLWLGLGLVLLTAGVVSGIGQIVKMNRPREAGVVEEDDSF